VNFLKKNVVLFRWSKKRRNRQSKARIVLVRSKNGGEKLSEFGKEKREKKKRVGTERKKKVVEVWRSNISLGI